MTMEIQFTARKFRARDELKEHAVDAVKKLSKFYDGILSADIILSYERQTNSVKSAEINLHVHGTLLSAHERSDDYYKSVDAAAEKLNAQLSKYKAKIRAKDKTTVRRMKAKE
jgi:putative sigma-54 modulation protein